MSRRLVREGDAPAKELRRLVDIPKLLDWFGIKYRTHGTELWASCPHPQHEETRASWSIHNDPTRQGHGSHHCFGCGFEGGPLDIITERLGFTRGYAVHWLTEKGMWLEGVVELGCDVEIRRPRSATLRVPRGLLGGHLSSWPKSVRSYLEGRGITPEQVERWGIQYSVDGDMAGRIVFPILDEGGVWKSYHARTFVDHDKRYKNASVEDGFDPGAIFGMRHWPPTLDRRSLAVVVTEGAINGLSCENATAKYIGALGGSEAHMRQLLQLSTWGTVICATDGDAAGDKLAAQIASALRAHSVVYRAPIPKGCDANELTPDELEEVLAWQ